MGYYLTPDGIVQSDGAIDGATQVSGAFDSSPASSSAKSPWKNTFNTNLVGTDFFNQFTPQALAKVRAMGMDPAAYMWFAKATGSGLDPSSQLYNMDYWNNPTPDLVKSAQQGLARGNSSPNGLMDKLMQAGVMGLIGGAGMGALGFGPMAAGNGLGWSMTPDMLSSMEGVVPSTAGAAGAAGGSGMASNWLTDVLNYAGDTTGAPIDGASSGNWWDNLTQDQMNNVGNGAGGAYEVAPGVSSSSLLNTIKQYGGDIKSAMNALGITGQMAGSALSSLLGYSASNKQTSALNSLVDKYSEMGAPYRQKLADLYADPSKFLKDPSVTTSVDQGTNSLMRSLSTQGNPWGSGNALQQGQDYATKSLYGQLGAEKDRLAGFGGLTAYNQAAPQAATNAIASTSNAANAIGSGIGNIFNPPQTAAQQMSALQKALNGTSGGGY